MNPMLPKSLYIRYTHRSDGGERRRSEMIAASGISYSAHEHLEIGTPDPSHSTLT